MNTVHYDHAVVRDDHYIIAAGGWEYEKSVELFTLSTNTWSSVTSLPQYLPDITATSSGGIIYAMDDVGTGIFYFNVKFDQ